MRAVWLEPDVAFEGVGAHPLNHRYDSVDETEPTRYSTGQPAYFTGALAASPVRLDGIDISHYQYDAGPVNLGTVGSIPTSWFAMKATQSTNYVDPTWARARAAADLAGFRHKLAYHWLSSTTPAGAQAAHFLRTVGPLPASWGVMLDAEEAGITVGMCLMWCETVEAGLYQMTGIPRPAANYTGLYVAGGTIYKSALLRESWFGLRTTTVAAYVSEANLNARIASLGAPGFDAWQFSSNGPVAGITGRCDMNRVDNHLAFDRVCGLTAAPVPIPTPQPEPTPAPIGNEDDMRFVRNAGTGEFWEWGTGWFPKLDENREWHGEWEWTSWASPIRELGLRWEEIGPLIDALGGLKDVPHETLQPIYDRHGRPPAAATAGPAGPPGPSGTVTAHSHTVSGPIQ